MKILNCLILERAEKAIEDCRNDDIIYKTYQICAIFDDYSYVGKEVFSIQFYDVKKENKLIKFSYPTILRSYSRDEKIYYKQEKENAIDVFKKSLTKYKKTLEGKNIFLTDLELLNSFFTVKKYNVNREGQYYTWNDFDSDCINMRERLQNEINKPKEDKLKIA